MYIPDMFRQVDTAAMQQLIAEQPLATLVMATDDGLEANHIPLYWVDIDADTVVLRGHVAKANPMWRQCAAATDVLVIFAGAQLYMSPNYYATKQIDAKVVPTWNYLSVHLHGDLVAIHDTQWKHEMLNRLTDQQEASQPVPWQVADAPAAHVEKLMGAIVGLEFRVTSIEGKWKASQNQPLVNKVSVVDHLRSQTADNSLAMADLVSQSIPRKQPE
ncbi:FMN-binding negative transcriptional regulator [Reinekea sp.]|uniref:FMN-binding negative transcriptional regulator n=1 Tax=Reinekea sp. TaxID=1970455 RepID=UPI00257E5447|nr:FMN-binding negative transcriptional regulator [Reinekea sp.]